VVTAAGADVRGFYAALGIELPGWSSANVNVRCFADPDAHDHGDRTPSCSISLQHGAWHCFRCGARGGAYDAGLALGRSPREAIDLMVAHGVTERRPTGERATRAAARGQRQPVKRAARASARRVLHACDGDVARWQEALFSGRFERLRRRLWAERRWTPRVLAELEAGYDGKRITVPIRDAEGLLQGVLRYRHSRRGPKILCAAGTRLGLVPHPTREPSAAVVLVEGLSDMLAARSAGWPAIAVPGVEAWKPEWGALLSGRRVTVVMDCDDPGRAAAQRIAADLGALAAVRIVDLAPERADGFDVTDWLRSHPHAKETNMQRILIVEGDGSALTALGDELLLDGHDVHTASADRQARLALAEAAPDALVLGRLNTPVAGLELLRDLRAGEIPGADPRLPVLALGADSDQAAMRLYKAGADVALPAVASAPLISEALTTLGERAAGAGLRRRILRVGALTVDCDARTATVKQAPVNLSRLEFDLLQTLATQPYRTHTRDELTRQVWGYDPAAAGPSRTLDSHAARLRQKLRAAGPDQLVQSVRGVGYRLTH